jgi:putative hemolysin
MWLEAFLIFIFVIINGFFAASEIAIVTTRRSRIRQLVEEGIPNAKLLYELRQNPDKFLATIQLGVTLAGAIASAIGGAAAMEIIKPALKQIPVEFISHSSEAIAIGIVVTGVTYISVIFGELIPKSLALSNAEGFSLAVAPLITAFSKIAIFFIKLLTASTNLLLSPIGRKAFTERAYISEEEVKLLLEEGGEQGIFEPEERELIHSVFEFTDTSVREVMIPAPQMVTIRSGMSMEEVRAVISEEKFSRYPVIGRDLNDIRGIVYVKDFYNNLPVMGADGLRKILKPPLFIPETMKISNLMREMQKKRVHLAVVVDEYGAVSGLVTMEDLLEEIVGEIRDEYDTESPVVKHSDGSMLIDASMSISDLNEDYHTNIHESPEYESLGGLMLAYLQRMPRPEDTVETGGMRLRIVEMAGQRILKIKLEPLQAPQGASPKDL